MSDVEDQRSGRVKRIAVHTRVSGKFGELLPDPTGGRRRKRARIFGTVIQAVDAKKYRVIFDNNQVLECFSNSLKVESLSTLPPDLRPTPPPDLTQPAAQEQPPPTLEQNDDSEGEHLPDHTPEEDETSVVHDAQEEEVIMPTEDLPVGALPTATQVDVTTDYRQQKNDAIRKVREQLGKTVREKSGNQTILWTVIDSHVPDNLLEVLPENRSIGWKDITTLKAIPKNQLLARLFLGLMYKDTEELKALVRKMNNNIKSTRDSRAKIFSPEEFIVGLGLLIGAAAFHQQGRHCWKEKEDERTDLTTEEEFYSLISHPNFDKYISKTHLRSSDVLFLPFTSMKRNSKRIRRIEIHGLKS